MSKLVEKNFFDHSKVISQKHAKISTSVSTILVMLRPIAKILLEISTVLVISVFAETALTALISMNALIPTLLIIVTLRLKSVRILLGLTTAPVLLVSSNSREIVLISMNVLSKNLAILLLTVITLTEAITVHAILAMK